MEIASSYHSNKISAENLNKNLHFIPFFSSKSDEIFSKLQLFDLKIAQHNLQLSKKFMAADLNSLLSLPFDSFLSHLAFDKSLLAFLDTFLISNSQLANSRLLNNFYSPENCDISPKKKSALEKILSSSKAPESFSLILKSVLLIFHRAVCSFEYGFISESDENVDERFFEKNNNAEKLKKSEKYDKYDKYEKKRKKKRKILKIKKKNEELKNLRKDCENLIYFCFDLPKMIDFCVIYVRTNKNLVRKIVERCFEINQSYFLDLQTVFFIANKKINSNKNSPQFMFEVILGMSSLIEANNSLTDSLFESLIIRNILKNIKNNENLKIKEKKIKKLILNQIANIFSIKITSLLNNNFNKNYHSILSLEDVFEMTFFEENYEYFKIIKFLKQEKYGILNLIKNNNLNKKNTTIFIKKQFEKAQKINKMSKIDEKFLKNTKFDKNDQKMSEKLKFIAEIFPKHDKTFLEKCLRHFNDVDKAISAILNKHLPFEIKDKKINYSIAQNSQKKVNEIPQFEQFFDENFLNDDYGADYEEKDYTPILSKDLNWDEAEINKRNNKY